MLQSLKVHLVKEEATQENINGNVVLYVHLMHAIYRK